MYRFLYPWLSFFWPLDKGSRKVRNSGNPTVLIGCYYWRLASECPFHKQGYTERYIALWRWGGHTFYLHRMKLVGDIVTYFWSLHDHHSPLWELMRTALLAGKCMWALDRYAESPVPVGKCLCLWAALHKERRAWTCIETQSKNRVMQEELRVLIRKLQETRQ